MQKYLSYIPVHAFLRNNFNCDQFDRGQLVTLLFKEIEFYFIGTGSQLLGNREICVELEKWIQFLLQTHADYITPVRLNLLRRVSKRNDILSETRNNIKKVDTGVGRINEDNTENITKNQVKFFSSKYILEILIDKIQDLQKRYEKRNSSLQILQEKYKEELVSGVASILEFIISYKQLQLAYDSIRREEDIFFKKPEIKDLEQLLQKLIEKISKLIIFMKDIISSNIKNTQCEGNLQVIKRWLIPIIDNFQLPRELKNDIIEILGNMQKEQPPTIFDYNYCIIYENLLELVTIYYRNIIMDADNLNITEIKRSHLQLIDEINENYLNDNYGNYIKKIESNIERKFSIINDKNKMYILNQILPELSKLFIFSKTKGDLNLLWEKFFPLYRQLRGIRNEAPFYSIKILENLRENIRNLSIEDVFKHLNNLKTTLKAKLILSEEKGTGLFPETNIEKFLNTLIKIAGLIEEDSSLKSLIRSRKYQEKNFRDFFKTHFRTNRWSVDAELEGRLDYPSDLRVSIPNTLFQITIEFKIWKRNFDMHPPIQQLLNNMGSEDPAGTLLMMNPRSRPITDRYKTELIFDHEKYFPDSYEEIQLEDRLYTIFKARYNHNGKLVTIYHIIINLFDFIRENN